MMYESLPKQERMRIDKSLKETEEERKNAPASEKKKLRDQTWNGQPTYDIPEDWKTYKKAHATAIQSII